MGKILVFVVTAPVLCFMLYKTVFFFEYDARQKYLKDLVDDTAFKVRLTGVLTSEDYEELVERLSRIGLEAVQGNGIVIKKGYFSGGELASLTEYTPGEVLSRGDVFMLLVTSANSSRLSKIFFGTTPGNKLHYKAKAYCRIEYAG